MRFVERALIFHPHLVGIFKTHESNWIINIIPTVTICLFLCIKMSRRKKNAQLAFKTSFSFSPGSFILDWLNLSSIVGTIFICPVHMSCSTTAIISACHMRPSIEKFINYANIITCSFLLKFLTFSLFLSLSITRLSADICGSYQMRLFAHHKIAAVFK